MGLILAVVQSAIALVTASPPPSPARLPDAMTILQRSESAWKGLNTYQVPVTISGSVRVSIISLPVHMTGTQYYQAPDQQALHLDNPPRLASGLGNTLSTMGTPQTWLRDYDIAMPVSQPHGSHSSYLLTGTPKRPSHVKSMTMLVSARSYGVESIVFSYTNGATLSVTFTRHQGISQYHLPRRATIVAKFPSYNGNATIDYGNYQINQPIPAAVFQQH
jgi:outer membrane lipoprotein-sorting protein